MPRINYRESALHAGDRNPDWFRERPQIPYVLPFLGYLIFMVPAALGHLGGIDWESFSRDYFPILYAGKSVTAAILLWVFWNYYTPIRWSRIPLGVAAGLFGSVLWIGTEYFCQHFGLAHPPDPQSFYNPDLLLGQQWQRLTYLCIRIVGPTLVVPVMEELFFRDFLMRALITGGQFEDVPVGSFTWPSLLIMSALFGINHGHQWPEGVLYGLLMGLLLIRTKSLGACIVAHGVTNLTLYLYVVYTGDWQFM